jgi:translin
VDDLETIAEEIRSVFEETHAARELALKRSRELIRICARAIRAMHREEWESAENQLNTAQQAAESLIEGVETHASLYHAGYTQDSLKEYVEARLTFALMRQDDLPTPAALHTEANTWLNGLAEAATELRRRILDIIRHGHDDEAERLLDKMDEIYSTLVTFDFSDSITGGLRRRTDTVRAVLERTRGDVTNSLRQAELHRALSSLEAKLYAAE